jgi:hypothetical protein
MLAQHCRSVECVLLPVKLTMPMIRKGQVRGIGKRDMRAQANFIAELFQVAA